jgi:hypothetical protein
VLNLKLKDQGAIKVEIFEGSDILEILKSLVSQYKLSKDLRDAI